MSLVGDISLTNKTGVFLGSVNLSNLNANAGDIVYSPDGFDLSGLALSDGLSSNGSQLSTIGNPNIQLTSNSLYVNDNVGATPLQDAVSSATQADTIYISSGSYGEAKVSILDKYNISLISPSCNNGTICELINGIEVVGTSENVRLSNLQIKGTSCALKGVGRHLFNNLNFSGGSITPLNVEVGKQSTNYMTFLNCDFNQYVNLTISPQFASVVYFINCNFGGCNIDLQNVSPIQVIFNNCAGFTAFPSVLRCTQVGMNVLVDGSVLQCNATRLYGIKSFVLQDGSDTLSSVNQALATDGVSGFKLVNLPDSVLRFVVSESGQYAGTTTASPLTLYQKAGQASIIPSIPSILQFSFNFDVTGGVDVLTLTLQQDSLPPSVITSLQFNVPSGKQTLAGQFNFTMPGNYTLDYSIIASLATHNITIDTTSAYGITMYQNNN
jgi:hypothetical protein